MNASEKGGWSEFHNVNKSRIGERREGEYEHALFWMNVTG